MLGDGGWTMRQGAAQMRRHTLAAQENLDGLLGDPCLDLLTYEAMRNTVVMFGNLDVIIEIDPTALPLGILVGSSGNGVSAGRSSSSNSWRRLRPQLRKARLFRSMRRPRIASLRAASEKKRRSLNRARIHLPTICTPTSTLALSLG